MAVTVYADVLVIVNLYVDFFLLWATRRVLDRKSTRLNSSHQR